jgi:protein-tyrosine-phosphatase
MTTIDILKRIKTKLGNRSTQNHYEEMLSDAAAEITELRRDIKDVVERAAKIVEEYEVHDPYVVGKIKIKARREAIAEQIRALNKAGFV